MTSNVSINGLSMFFTVKRFSLLWITLISSSFIFLACARTHRKQDAQIAFESEAMEPTPASSQVLVGALKNVRDGASDDQKLFQELNLQTSEAIFLFDPKPSGFGLVEIPPSLMRFLDPNYAEGLVTRTEALGAEGLERLDSLYKHRAPFASAVRQGQATENALRIHISDASKNTSIEAFEQTLKESDDKARLAEELLADLQKKDPRLPIQKDELEHLTIESFSSLYSKFNRRFAQLKAIDCDGCEEVSLLGSYRETEPKMLLLKTEFEKQTTRAIGKENFNKDATVTYRGVQLPPGSDLEATRAEVAKFENGQVQGKELPQAIEVAMNEYFSKGVVSPALWKPSEKPVAEWNTVPSEHFKSSSGSLFVSTTSSWKVAVNFATKKVAGQSQFTPSESQFGLVLVLAPREGEALTSHMNFKEREVAVPVKIDPDQVIGAYPLVKLESGETRVLSFVSNPRSSFSNSLVTQGPKADPQRLDRQAATERLIRDQSDDGVVAIYAKPYETVNTQLQRDIEIAKSATENMIETFTVNRYHHALAHGLRQGALAKDIANVMEQTNTPLGKWVKAQKRQDPFFLDKLEMVATYQRTGRRSESTRDTDEFYEDLHRSAQNFVIAARKPTPPNKTSMFRSNEEIAEYASAIVWQHVPKSFVRQKSSILDLPKIANSIDNFTENEEFIFQIVNAAHGLDGRRITNFNPIRTRREFSDFLDLSFDSVPVEILWQREAAYLKATGDTDRGVAPVRYRHDNEFFLQAKDPQRMVDAIYTVSKNLPRLVIGS